MIQKKSMKVIISSTLFGIYLSNTLTPVATILNSTMNMTQLLPVYHLAIPMQQMEKSVNVMVRELLRYQ